MFLRRLCVRAARQPHSWLMINEAVEVLCGGFARSNMHVKHWHVKEVRGSEGEVDGACLTAGCETGDTDRLTAAAT